MEISKRFLFFMILLELSIIILGIVFMFFYVKEAKSEKNFRDSSEGGIKNTEDFSSNPAIKEFPIGEESSEGEIEYASKEEIFNSLFESLEEPEIVQISKESLLEDALQD